MLCKSYLYVIRSCCCLCTLSCSFWRFFCVSLRSVVWQTNDGLLTVTSKHLPGLQVPRLQVCCEVDCNAEQLIELPGLPTCFFLKLDFEILAFFEHISLFFGNQKRPDKIWLVSMRKAWLWKNIVWATSSSQNLFWKVSITMQDAKILKRFYGCPKNDQCYWWKQMHDVITGKENDSKGVEVYCIDVSDKFYCLFCV